VFVARLLASSADGPLRLLFEPHEAKPSRVRSPDGVIVVLPRNRAEAFDAHVHRVGCVIVHREGRLAIVNFANAAFGEVDEHLHVAMVRITNREQCGMGIASGVGH
tara:strand:+ start:3719 stop:4036 length:318 start_codon:yes stop_codon:yes gene_type:complete